MTESLTNIKKYWKSYLEIIAWATWLVFVITFIVGLPGVVGMGNVAYAFYGVGFAGVIQSITLMAFAALEVISKEERND